MDETKYRIVRASHCEATIEQLADVLINCVEAGASIGFMLPLSRARARSFWQAVLESAARGERIVLVAEEIAASRIVGTVQVILSMPDNQPHRGDVAKMQVHQQARKQGLGVALLRAIEREAEQAGRTLLLLDTVTDSDAYRLYAKQGWQRVGEVPGYALWPQGGVCSTTFFYKQLRAETAANGSSEPAHHGA